MYPAVHKKVTDKQAMTGQEKAMTVLSGNLSGLALSFVKHNRKKTAGYHAAGTVKRFYLHGAFSLCSPELEETSSGICMKAG